LIGHLRVELRQWPPFQDMPEAEVDAALARCEQRYLEAGEVLLEPTQGPVDRLYLIRRGQVASRLGPRDDAFHYGAGDLLPIDALLGRRAVRATYTATSDVFVLTLSATEVDGLAARSPVFADFLRDRVSTLLEKSRRALQESLTSQVLAEQGMETTLGSLIRGRPVQCAPDAPLGAALKDMETQQVGSVMVTGPQGVPLGILTRHDLPRLVLDSGFDLQRPIAQFMRQPVRSLDALDTAQDAALLMSQYGFRHVPVTREGRLVGMVSERDLFALQRGSLQQVSTAIRRAQDLGALQAAAAGIRSFAQRLLAQGVQARQTTQLISHLNDLLTQQLLSCEARDAGVDLQRLCWVALGSEGRGEQTIATDQDNALVLPDATDPAERERLRRWADGVNRALDACGYPLCRGGVMAGQEAYCLSQGEWINKLAHWIEHGSPQDLLQASIVFDMRSVAGDPGLLAPLLSRVVDRVSTTPRFLHQMAVNALTRRPPLDWRGEASADEAGGVDLKLQATALFVDAARILGLAHGVTAAGTRERLQAAGQALGLQTREYDSWIGAFEFLQGLRLRLQVTPGHSGSDNPNWMPIDRLSDIDRRILAASLREAKRLQQRLALDYLR
jgi:CBS domain-containing protein